MSAVFTPQLPAPVSKLKHSVVDPEPLDSAPAGSGSGPYCLSKIQRIFIKVKYFILFNDFLPTWQPIVFDGHKNFQVGSGSFINWRWHTVCQQYYCVQYIAPLCLQMHLHILCLCNIFFYSSEIEAKRGTCSRQVHVVFVLGWFTHCTQYKLCFTCTPLVLLPSAPIRSTFHHLSNTQRAWSGIHERTISLRFPGIILRVLSLEVSGYNVYITNQF